MAVTTFMQPLLLAFSVCYLAVLCRSERIEWKINLGGDAVDGFQAEEAVLNVDENFAKMRYHGMIKGSGEDLNVFKTQRFSRAEDLVLNFPVPDGVYSVTLMFSETWKGAFGSGNRVFDVYLGSKPNGVVKVIEAMDPFRSGGPAGAVRRKFTGIATQGGLTLALRPIKQNPQIAGIVISGYSYGKSYMEELPTVPAGPSEGEDFSSLNNMGPSLPSESHLIYDPSLNPKLRSSSASSTPSGSSPQSFTMNTNNNVPSSAGSLAQQGTSNGFGGSSGASNGFGGSSGASNGFGGSSGASNGFGGSSGASNSFGGSSGASNGFSGSSGASSGFGGSSGASNGFGGSSETSNTFGATQSPPNVQTASFGTQGFSSSSYSGNPYSAVRQKQPVSAPDQVGGTRSDGGVAPVGGSSFGTFRRRRLASYGEEAPIAFPLTGSARDSGNQPPLDVASTNLARGDQNGGLGNANGMRSYQAMNQPMTSSQNPSASSLSQGNGVPAPNAPMDQPSSAGIDNGVPASFASRNSLNEVSNLAVGGQHQLLPQNEAMGEQQMLPSQNEAMGQHHIPLSQNEAMRQQQMPPSQNEAMGQQPMPPSQNEAMGQQQMPPSQNEAMGQEQMPPSQNEVMGQQQMPPSQNGAMGQEQMSPSQIRESAVNHQEEATALTGVDSNQPGPSTLGFESRRVLPDTQVRTDGTGRDEQPTSDTYPQTRPDFTTRIGSLKPTSFKLDSDGIRDLPSPSSGETVVGRKRTPTEIMNGIRAQLQSLIQQTKAMTRNENESAHDDASISERQASREGHDKLGFKSFSRDSADPGSQGEAQVIQNYRREEPSALTNRYDDVPSRSASGSRSEVSTRMSQPHLESEMHGGATAGAVRKSSEAEREQGHHRFSGFRGSVNDIGVRQAGKNVRRFSDLPDLPPGIIEGGEAEPEAPAPAGVHIGSENLDGICINNSTHCSCGMVTDSNPEECLYVVKEDDVGPMLCVRRPCSGKLVCACAPGASSLCVRSTVMEILVPSTVHKHGETEESEIVQCRREKLEHGIGVLTPVV